MKIIILGGLGYIGYTLAERYVSKGHEVIIVDNNMYGKWADGESLVCPVIHEDVVRLKELPDKPDLLCICSDIDHKEFCDSQYTQDYQEAYCKQIMKICGTLDEKSKVLHLMTSGGFSVKSKVKGAGRVTEMIPPSLFGTARAFRSDTFINEAVMALCAEKRYVLTVDPFEFIHIAFIHDYVTSIIEEKEFYIDHVPTIVIINILQNLFGSDYQIGIMPQPDRALEIRKQNIELSYITVSKIELFIKEVLRGMETGTSEELFKPQYNNTHIMNEIITSFKYKDRFNV